MESLTGCRNNWGGADVLIVVNSTIAKTTTEREKEARGYVSTTVIVMSAKTVTETEQEERGDVVMVVRVIFAKSAK